MTAIYDELDGRYLLRELAQQAGRAELWHGWDMTLQRPVTIKLADGAELVDEVQVLTTLRHPGLPELFDASPAHAARAYLVLEHLGATTLHDRLERRDALDQRLALSVGRRLAELLCHLHEQGWALGGVETRGVWLLADDEHSVVKVADVRRVHRDSDASFAADIASLGALLAATGLSLPGRLSAMTATDPTARPDAVTVLQELARRHEPEVTRGHRTRAAVTVRRAEMRNAFRTENAAEIAR